jgi:hypothetical protein
MRGPTPPYSPPLAFKVITLFLVLMTAAILSWGLTHVSDIPAIFGRYSRAYAIFLVSIATLLAVLLVSLLRPRVYLTQLILNTYLFTGATVLSLVAVEFGLRIFNPWGIDFFDNLPYHMQGMVDDDQLGYVHPRSVSYYLGKNFVSLNSHGLRDEDFPLAKPAGERRILVLGDSVAFGWGVSQGETFSDRMEPLLHQLTGKQWQVINAGVNGYNSSQESKWFRLHGIRFQPDIVVLLYVSNDVDPVIDPNVNKWRRYPNWPGSLPELIDRSRSLSYLFQMGKLMKVARDLQQAREGQPLTAPPTSITTHSGWRASRQALVDISKTCRESGISFIVAQEDELDLGMVEQLAQVGIEVISLKDMQLKLPLNEQYVSRVDPHPSATVHNRMAIRLVEELNKRDWLR